MFRLSSRAGLALPLIVAGTALVSSLVYLVAMRSAAHGALVAPLDDAYIYFQYARAIADGHPFAYTSGADPTMGATGFLYPFLLAPAFLVGLDGGAVTGYAFTLNVVLFMVVAVLVYLLACRHTGPFLALTAGLLTALAGPVIWGFLSMMEIGLLALGVTLLAYFFSVEKDSYPPWRTLATAVVLPFCRPEGAFMAVFVAAIVLTRHIYTVRGRPAQVGPRWRAIDLAVFAPVVAAIAYFFSLWLITGSLTTSTFVSKAIQYDAQSPWYEKLGDILDNAAILLQDPFGLNPVYLPVVILTIAGLGLAWQIGQEVVERYPGLGILVLGLFFISVLSNSQSVGALGHHYRYIIPLFPLVMVFLAIGLRELGRLQPGGRRLATGAAMILLPLMLINGVQWVSVYAENVRDIDSQQVHMGHWVRENLPAGAVIGINDAGAITYYSGHRVYDLVGLVTEGSALPYRNQTGAVFEWLLSLPPEDRPAYFVIYPDWFEFPYSVFLKEIYRDRLNETSIAGSPTVAVYSLDYSVADGASEPELDHTDGGAWQQVDSLNSADLADEKRHGYRQIDLVPRGGVAATVLREHVRITDRTRRLIDGGRVVLGAEELTVATRGGADLRIVMRANPLYLTRLRVYADGQYAGEWTYPAGTGPWTEPSFTVPGELVKEGDTRLRIEIVTDLSNRDYTPFHYWFYQPVAAAGS